MAGIVTQLVSARRERDEAKRHAGSAERKLGATLRAQKGAMATIAQLRRAMAQAVLESSGSGEG